MTPEETPRNDRILGPSVRLTIMLLLFVHGKVLFAELRRLLAVTPGNLNHHLAKLAGEGYIELTRRFSPRRPVTVVAITEKGRSAFQNYITRFRQILDRIEQGTR
jgi:DNA-binding MarR family transcriptional regulator